MTMWERVSLWAFQFKLFIYEIWSNIVFSKDLWVLGINLCELMDLGKGKQVKVMEMVLMLLGIEIWYEYVDMFINCYVDVMVELIIFLDEGEVVMFCI